jgi:uncharacterized metal-binding protein
VVIDGCDMACAYGVLEQAEIPVKNYLVVTDLSINKNKNMDLVREEIDRVKQAVRNLCEPGIVSPAGFCSCRNPEK